MIKPVSKNRPAQFVNDFQVYKGSCEKTMKPFGQPVAVAHEAYLMIRDDQKNLGEGASALYCVHQRSENRILKIERASGKAAVTVMPVRRPVISAPVLKAA
ncbi:MAG: hypothetical protein JO061_16120 [Acidobacteriaceae bacterium]|nr:hypothetical protein [Acidobacteriaceae bacterium]